MFFNIFLIIFLIEIYLLLISHFHDFLRLEEFFIFEQDQFCFVYLFNENWMLRWMPWNFLWEYQLIIYIFINHLILLLFMDSNPNPSLTYLSFISNYSNSSLSNPMNSSLVNIYPSNYSPSYSLCLLSSNPNSQSNCELPSVLFLTPLLEVIRLKYS